MAERVAAPDYRALLNLDGRGFVVLGAGDGIGAQISHALAQCGARLFCVDVFEDRAQLIADAVGGEAFTADMTTAESVSSVFEQAQASLGRIDGIVDVIGVARIKPIAEYADEEFEWQFGIVVRHALYTLREAARSMPAGGPITFVGSMSGNRAVANQIVYGSAKAALHHLVRGAAAELGPKGIRVNAIAPGFIRTPRLLELLDTAQWKEIDRHVPTGRAATTQQIASALLFLSSDMASHVNGAVLPVDGGVSVTAALPDLKFGPASRGEPEPKGASAEQSAR
jgi:3alpha(or 20beta)-hydroxysteroid dehydrogenase